MTTKTATDTDDHDDPRRRFHAELMRRVHELPFTYTPRFAASCCSLSPARRSECSTGARRKANETPPA